MGVEGHKPDSAHGLPETQAELGKVSVYGAGIAGLTAAHELAIRGFQVRVYECALASNEVGVQEMAIGGLARTQYHLVDDGAASGGVDSRFPESPFTAPQVLSYPPFVGELSPEGKKLSDGVLTWLDMFVKNELPHWPIGLVHVHADLAPAQQALAPRLAAMVRDNLRDRIDPETFDPGDIRAPQAKAEPVTPMIGGTFVGGGKGSFPGNQNDLTQVLGMDASQPQAVYGSITLKRVYVLPGEHGFRFFPSFYRHLFSTMIQIPLFDRTGRLTGQRVFDNLVESSFQGIAAQGRRIRFVRRAPITTPYELLQELLASSSSGYTPSDLAQAALRILRFMCTSAARRTAELDGVSWWEYLEGYDPRTGARRFRYSDKFQKDMEFAPRVLAAFDSTWGDAHTNGNILVQLILNFVRPLPKTDGTLTGPTSTTFLRPWRTYLEYLGVQFQTGTLKELKWEGGKLQAWLETNDESTGQVKLIEDPWQPDYQVVATDVATAETVTRNLPEIGVPKALKKYTTEVLSNPRGTEPAQLRDPSVYGRAPWDRFQTLTGIQFFFPYSVRLSEGYLYFMDAPWGLSAVNSQQYWRVPPSLARHGFGALMTVDIGNWRLFAGQEDSGTWTREGIALEVWRQIQESTKQHGAPLPDAAQSGFALPRPTRYHLDENILFDSNGRPTGSRAPYLIPLVGDWDRRPGAEPWDPLAPDPPLKPDSSNPTSELWQAPHGGYCVHWGKLVFAGTYLKTFTRLTSMEAANESARHAVNAILDHYLSRHPEVARPIQRDPLLSDLPGPAYSRLGSLTGWPEFRMTPIGEYCPIWDPEKHELPELEPIKKLDDWLCSRQMPHVWDVLRVEALIAPVLQALGPTQPLQSLLVELLQRLRAIVVTSLRPAGAPAK